MQLPPEDPPPPTTRPKRAFGNPTKRRKGDDGIDVPFPRNTFLAERVHSYSLNCFPKIRRLIGGGFQTWKENGAEGLGAVLRKSQSLTHFFRLHEHDLLDLERTQGFFEDLVALQNAGGLQEVNGLYENFGLSYLESMTAEVLAKVICYREGLEGKTLNLPAWIDGRWQSVPYLIRSLTLGESLPVIVLSSEEPLAPNWIVPRGTSPWFGFRQGAVESIEADVACADGLDVSVIAKAEAKISEWLNECQNVGGRVIFAGHSLGGVLAVHMGVDAALFNPTIYTFNPPGVGAKTRDLYQALANKPAVVQFMTEGDIIPSAGHFLLGRILAVQLVGQPFRLLRRPFEEHVCLTLNQSHNLREVDAALEENTMCRRVMETFIRARFLNALSKPFIYLSQTRAVQSWGFGSQATNQTSEE